METVPVMTKEEALDLFNGKPVHLAKALGISKQAVNNWEPGKAIPKRREMQIRYEILPSRDDRELDNQSVA